MLIWLKKSTAAKREQHSQSTASMGARQRNGTVDGEPLVQVLALGQYDGVAQVAASQSGLCILFELHEMKGGESARTQGRAGHGVTWYCLVPSLMFFCGLNVLLRFLLNGGMLKWAREEKNKRDVQAKKVHGCLRCCVDVPCSSLCFCAEWCFSHGHHAKKKNTAKVCMKAKKKCARSK